MGVQIQVSDDKGAGFTHLIEKFPCKVGRNRENQLVLSGWSVGRTHLELIQVDKAIRVVDAGSLSGTWINGRRIVDYGPLDSSDEIVVAGYKLRLIDPAGASTPVAAAQVAVSEQNQSEKKQPDAAVSIPTAAQIGLRRKLHSQLLRAVDLRRKDVRSLSDEQLHRELDQLLQPLLDAEEPLPVGTDRSQLAQQLLSEALGFGPLDPLLQDASITEIMVNGANQIFIERSGRIEQYPGCFSTDDAVRHIIDRIVNPIGRRIDDSSPMVDARLPDGSRVNAIIPPLALRGPSITIRKFAKKRFSPQDLVGMQALSAPMLAFLRVCIEQRKNIVVSGGTGSGKTTLLNVLSSLIPSGERIVTIEDSAELRLEHRNLVALEARPPNVEGRGAVTIRDLVKNALRMRPDRIVVGEVRGGESLDMLQAMNTGHDGSLTTVHANSGRDVFSRLEVMALMAGIDLPIQALREQICSAVDLVVHQTRFHDGKRRVTAILEVTGIEAGKINAQEIFVFKSRRTAAGLDGQFCATGVMPSFYEDLKRVGQEVDYQIFAESTL
jgi:pilus assembly protein CpaF